MPLSWTQPWELGGQWTPAPDEDPSRAAPPEKPAAGLFRGWLVGVVRSLSRRLRPRRRRQPRTLRDQDAARRGSDSDVESGPDQGLFANQWPAYGTLRFSADEGLRVQLLGPLGDPFAASSTFPLWGETLAGEACTLLGAYVNHERGTLGGHAQREVVGPVFVRGAHVRQLADLPIQRARLRFPGLREFLWHPHLGPVGLAEREEDGERIHERVIAVRGARLTFRLAWEKKSAVHEQARERPGEVDVTLDEPLASQVPGRGVRSGARARR
jgi:hypothetical protein